MNIGVVIVTYNRFDKLKRCLAQYELQTYQPSHILVIDNASTDNTAKYLDEWMHMSHQTSIQRSVIHNSQNTGGAGGFAEGIFHMLTEDVDWIWLADDDAYPDNKCLERIMEYSNSIPSENMHEIVSLSAKVVDINGEISELHRRKLHKGFFHVKEVPLWDDDFKTQAVEINIFSFVGTMIRSSAVKELGLPRKDFFIFYDDTEFSLRTQALGKHICVSSAVVIHDSPEKKNDRYSWKNYYMFRNKLYTYRLYFPVRYVICEICKIFFMILLHYNCSASWKQFSYALKDMLCQKTGRNHRFLPDK